MPNHRRIFTSILLMSLAGLCAGETLNTPEPTDTGPLLLAPTSHIYSPYLADPRRVTFAFQVLSMLDSEVPDTGAARIALRMGGRLELFKWTDPDAPWQALQANLEVGFRGLFDPAYSLDNIGWDGNYGLLFSYRQDEGLAYRFGLYHNSGHLGDEYAERTGRKRIAYTREELLAGTQLNLTPYWQYYLEGAYCYNHGEKTLQERYRAQTGIQYQQHAFSPHERLGWYAGLDLSAYEEYDWRINKAVEVGFAFAAAPHVWRLALDYYQGQSVLGEFFQYEEEYLGVGLYLDM